MENTGSVETELPQPKLKGYKWLRDSTGKLLFVTACLTVVYLSFLGVDALVLFLIDRLLGDVIMKYSFVQNGFDGLRIFSAMVIGLMYLIHLGYTVYDQVSFIGRVSKKMREEENENS